MSKPALGRGLGALLGGTPSPAPSFPASPSGAAAPDNIERVQRVPLNRIRPSPLQPRKYFAPEALQELAASIREQGIMSPLIVRERDGLFELIAGERRWRAAQLLNLSEAPVITREADDRTVLELALIENVQRENLNPLEEAFGYAHLGDRFNLTQEEIALKVGKSRAAVANATRLLRLPASVQSWVRENRLSIGHAKVILSLAESAQQLQVAERALKEGLNVRQTEELIAGLMAHGQKEPSNPATPAPSAPADANLARLEQKLREKFGSKVLLKYAQGKGTVEISFFSDAELQRVLDILNISAD